MFLPFFLPPLLQERLGEVESDRGEAKNKQQ